MLGTEAIIMLQTMTIGGKILVTSKGALSYNFIDFKKGFDRVWHEGLWRILTEYNIDNRLLEV